jgi:hypothetical protein
MSQASPNPQVAFGSAVRFIGPEEPVASPVEWPGDPA